VSSRQDFQSAEAQSCKELPPVNRFVCCADAASVFPLVQAIAFSVALSEPGICCAIAGIWLLDALGNIVFSALLTVPIVQFRRA
jgi:hypothetical protein